MTRWNVRVKSPYPVFKKPDGSMSNEWTYQQEAINQRMAASLVLYSLFGPINYKKVARVFVTDIEVWKAEKYGIGPRDIWRGRAS